MRIIFLGLLLILIAGFIVYKVFYKEQEGRVSTFPDRENRQTENSFLTEAEKVLKNLTLEQKIGQLFIIGFEGKILNSEIENLIKEIHPGGILLLERNIENKEQLKELIGSLQEIALEDTGLPLLIAIDQEGGIISRVEWVEKTPQSKIENTEQSYQIGRKRGKELKELGINLNLAPLLDASLPKDFIFERTFQKNLQVTGELAGALVRGQKEAGILTAIKHFPGYGGISFNPEEKLATLEKVPEISQFQKVAQVLPEMIMVSNVIYKDIDGELPFGLSTEGIKFLKSKIQGNYLVISDDLAQNSLLKKLILKDIVTLPIKSGVDILIFSGWRIPVIEGVAAFQEAVENGEIQEERIDKSVLKIIELKQRLF